MTRIDIFPGLVMILIHCYLMSACDSTPYDDYYKEPLDPIVIEVEPDTTTSETYNCGDPYPEMESSPYVLPYLPGESYTTGLTNCSNSYHASGRPDQFAFDFDMPLGTPFTASRGGTVHLVIENQASSGGGAGNYVVIKHQDGTYAFYLHSPQNGIEVKSGEEVKKGDILGVTGQSGLAGYPHLHLIVTTGDSYPYQGIPIAFKNAKPAHVPLLGYTEYQAEDY